MKTRNLNLAILTESNNILDFIKSIPAEDFVKVHQDNFKDHYLTDPEIDLSHLIEEFDMLDVIREKYQDFFMEKGVDETYKWLNPSLYTDWSEYLKTEDFPMTYINYELFGTEIEDEDQLETCYDMFNDLYYEANSGYGYSSFMKDLLSMYNYELVD
jgi:hypothetical protein